MTSTSILHRTVNAVPIVIERAEGNYMYDASGKAILDASGGPAVSCIGHGRSELAKAAAEQILKVDYVCSFPFTTEPAEELSHLLTKDSPFERVVYNSGGSEAIESAIKLCRQYHYERGQPQRASFISRWQSYHGNTLGALGLARHAVRRAPYLSILADFSHEVMPCNAYRFKEEGETDEGYVERLKGNLEAKFQELGPGTVAAFFAETVVGATTGCVGPVPGYLAVMKEVCHRHGALFVLDEIMCGMGRTGKRFAWEHSGPEASPDVLVVGKTLASGYAPLSAMLMTGDVVRGFKNGAVNNGFTHQNHALACRLALEVQKIVVKEKLLDQCAARGIFLESQLTSRLASHPNVGDVRGVGLFWAVEFVKDKATKQPFAAGDGIAEKVHQHMLDNGVFCYPGKGTADGADGDHLILAPMYTVSEQQIVDMVDAMENGIHAVLGK